MLVRTQLLLDTQLKQALVLISQHKNQSISQLVRNYVGEKVAEEMKAIKKQKKISAIQSMWRMVRAAKKFKTKGPQDLARKHDSYLY